MRGFIAPPAPAHRIGRPKLNAPREIRAKVPAEPTILPWDDVICLFRCLMTM
jgi:hypothetical protein